MSKINISKIDKTNLVLQLIFGATILLAYFSSKMLMWAAGGIALFYLFSSASWEQKFSFFMFALPFSVIFKLSADQTSLFMFLRVGVVFSFAFQNNKQFNTKFLIITITTFVYIVFLSAICNTDYLVSAINIALWIFVGYILMNTISTKTSTPVTLSLSNGIIITGIIGLFVDNLTPIHDVLQLINFISADGARISRPAGLMSDPNFFTVLIISALWFVYYEFNKAKISIFEFIIRCALVSFLGLMTMSKSCAILLLFFWFYLIVAKNNIETSSKVVLFFSLVIAMLLFIWKNPYWLGDILYRFTGSGSEVTADVFTTGRSKIWQLYTDKIFLGFRWIFGYGLCAELPEGKAAHNTIIQLVYNLGTSGTVLIISLFRCVYTSVLGNVHKHRSSNVSRCALFSLLLSLMFLDGLSIEMFYYMLFMSFVYMSENNRKDIYALEIAAD